MNYNNAQDAVKFLIYVLFFIILLALAIWVLGFLDTINTIREYIKNLLFG
jgi:hypothetical protein